MIVGFGGTVYVSILPTFLLPHFRGISGVTLTFLAEEMLYMNQRCSAGTQNTFAMKEMPNLFTSNLKGHSGKGGGQIQEPDLGGNGELLVGLRQWDNYD